MKKQLLSILTLGLSICSFGQISEGGLPTTFSKTIQGETSEFQSNYQIIDLGEPNMVSVYAEDALIEAKHEGYRTGINHSVSYSIINNGTWELLDNGDKIWRLGVKMSGAQGLGLYFSQAVSIPKGGKLHAYNANHSQYVGAYTSNTPTFQSMEVIEGEILTLEYFMPAGSTQLPTIEISEIVYFYRGVNDRVAAFREGFSTESQIKAHQSCEVDVACSEITGWETQRDAAVQYSFSSGGGTYVCSGAMVNNTNNDCKPYFLTANHCGEPTNNASITNHTFYFNYQRPTCAPGNTNSYNGAQSQSVSGGMLRASSQLGNQSAGTNQVSGTDFVLIEFNNNLPASYNAYYSGWDRATNGATSGVGIHHPAGDEKKISTYGNTLTSATYNGGWASAHWEVQWAATANGHGVTEGGSSGSPIFNQAGLIVGHLSGGSSFCTATSATDLYGKFIKAWDQEGNNNNQRLKPWLDPANTNPMTFTGSYAPCNGGGGGGNGGTLCAATSTNCDEFISKFELNTIDNSSACDNYSDFTSQSTDLFIGVTYTATITPQVGTTVGQAYTNDEMAIYIDWNNDNDFDDAGERVAYVIVATGWSNVFTFTVPSTATLGDLAMRVRISFSTDDGPISPCGESQWGEVEDYTVKIKSDVSVKANQLENIAIYPNPTNSILSVNLNGINVDQIVVTDVTGRVVATEVNPTGIVSFDLSSQSAGVYFVRINSQNSTLTKKVIRL